MNLSDDRTEKELKKLSKEIAKIYRQAAKELAQKADEYWNGYTDDDGNWQEGYFEKYEKERKKWEAGEYTDQEWETWQRIQIGIGKRWESMRDQMVNIALNANEVAIAFVNDATPAIYALNHNYSLYQIENAYSNTSFTITDANAVRRLIRKKNHVNFRVLRHDRTTDYRWNKSRITNALMQGIIQGESPEDISKRFLSVMDSNMSAAMRNARTAVTSAQNAGRIDSYKKASDAGIVIEKEWLAAADGRTRESHAKVNGQRKPWNKPFEMQHGTLNYPGDPDGYPSEVYNCRCTVIPILPVVKEKVPEYADWLKGK